MSCDWHIHCVTCKSTHRFDDANHRDEMMLDIIKHAAAIAGLAGLPEIAKHDIKLTTTYYGDIDPTWFRDHLGHDLRPIDEYGGLATQCHEYVACTCGTSRRCVLDRGHDGAHATVKVAP